MPRDIADAPKGSRLAKVAFWVVIVAATLTVLLAILVVVVLSEMFDSDEANDKALAAAQHAAQSLALEFGQPPPDGQPVEQYLRETTARYPGEILEVRPSGQTTMAVVMVRGVASAVPGPFEAKRCFEFSVPAQATGQSVPFTELGQCPPPEATIPAG
ncbi:hypothetical protein [Amycolatopsis nigrescens]|uniref:hypothetical protein n=1 Tax=Amycolatopsis nigrescens TaxID=381445 RepID=UPI0003740411|nr:hypothetical protein [Amycolatopsis nigrescens]